MRAVRRLLEEGQGRRLLIGAAGLLVLIPTVLFLERMLPHWTFKLLLYAGTMFSVYLLHRGRPER